MLAEEQEATEGGEENMNGKWTHSNFLEFDADNPEIYEMFKRFALIASQHRKRYSARGIFHRLRWETMLTGRESDFKIDDGWSPHYARKFMNEYPKLEGFFETRIRKNSYHRNEEPLDE